MHVCHAGKQANRVDSLLCLVSVVASSLRTCGGPPRPADTCLVQRVCGTGSHAQALSSGTARAPHRRGSPPAAPQAHNRHVQGEAQLCRTGPLVCPASHMQPCNTAARAGQSAADVPLAAAFCADDAPAAARLAERLGLPRACHMPGVLALSSELWAATAELPAAWLHNGMIEHARSRAGSRARRHGGWMPQAPARTSTPPSFPVRGTACRAPPIPVHAGYCSASRAAKVSPSWRRGRPGGALHGGAGGAAGALLPQRHPARRRGRRGARLRQPSAHLLYAPLLHAPLLAHSATRVGRMRAPCTHGIRRFLTPSRS